VVDLFFSVVYQFDIFFSNCRRHLSYSCCWFSDAYNMPHTYFCVNCLYKNEGDLFIVNLEYNHIAN